MNRAAGRRSTPTRFALAAIVVACIACDTAVAQSRSLRGSIRGLSASVAIGYDRLSLDGPVEVEGRQYFGDDVTLSGGNVDIALSYGFGEYLAVFVEGSGSTVNAGRFDTGGAGHFDVGVRYYLPPEPALTRSYVFIARTGRALVIEDALVEDFGGPGTDAEDLEAVFGGAGLSWGVGLHNFIGPNLALDVRFLRTRGRFSNVKHEMTIDGERLDTDVSIDERARTTRISVGLAWYIRR